MNVPLNKAAVKNEEEAIRKLCENGPHVNIVEVLTLGELLDSAFHYIDMELCDMNLDDHMNPPNPPSLSFPYYFIKDAPPPLKAQQVWNIMKHIASGVQFMHSLNLVHRDLKPTNGTLHLAKS